MALASCGGEEDNQAAVPTDPPSDSQVDPDPNPSPSNDPEPEADPDEEPTPDPEPDPDPTPTANEAPTIGGSPLAEVMVGDDFEFTPTAEDGDGDVLTFSIANAPAWASFDASTGRLAGTPEDGDVRTYAGIVISVSDGEATTELPAFDIDVVSTGTGTATLTWEAPTEKTDGSALNVAGYKVYWGTEPGEYSHEDEVEGSVLTYVVDELTAATWYFAVTAIDEQDMESDFSNEASKEIL